MLIIVLVTSGKGSGSLFEIVSLKDFNLLFLEQPFDSMTNELIMMKYDSEVGGSCIEYDYVIQYDSPGGDSMSLTLMGRYLFNQKSEFADKVTDLITEHGITDWAYHPYTDVWQIMEKFNIACLNLAAGYYKYHTENEYVVVDDVQNGYNLGLKLVEILGENSYKNYKEDKKHTYLTYWGGETKVHNPAKSKNLLVEDTKDETDGDDIFNNGEYVCTDRGRKDYGYGPYNTEWDEDYDY